MCVFCFVLFFFYGECNLNRNIETESTVTTVQCSIYSPFLTSEMSFKI